MNKIVLDASALLALINQESGLEIVEESLSKAVMSAVNVSEVATVLCNLGMPVEECKILIAELLSEIHDFDENQAFITASLREKTKHKGLSFGDRACLALATIRNMPVLTADKIWADLDIGLQITIIR